MRLFSYRMKTDAGSAPNPYGGRCTLVICKPKIRAVAEEKDWIVGLASESSSLSDPQYRVIYAMEVTRVVNHRGYDELCRKELKIKIPTRPARTFQEYVGDCIFNFSSGNEPLLRPSVHSEDDMRHDLGGKNALISDHFFYFGAEAVLLPEHLWPIAKRGRSHQSDLNEPYKEQFVKWITGFEKNRIYSDPLDKIADWKNSTKCGGCSNVDTDEEISDWSAI